MALSRRVGNQLCAPEILFFLEKQDRDVIILIETKHGVVVAAPQNPFLCGTMPVLSLGV